MLAPSKTTNCILVPKFYDVGVCKILQYSLNWKKKELTDHTHGPELCCQGNTFLMHCKAFCEKPQLILGVAKF